jgi:hypothetical protein
MKIIFLLAPSEWKNIWWNSYTEKLSFNFSKPTEISHNVTEKDLKCKWTRFDEGLELNRNLDKWPFLEAIHRYSGVVFNAIDYKWMSESGKNFFEDHVFILSGMYWKVHALDNIWNYKLPIETKWLYDFWWHKIALEIAKMKADYIVNLLPDSYAKLVWIWKSKKLEEIRNLYLWEKTKIINLHFLTEKDWKIVKLTHWVKKYRGEYLRNICENNLTNYEQFPWKIVKNWDVIDIDIIIKK